MYVANHPLNSRRILVDGLLFPCTNAAYYNHLTTMMQAARVFALYMLMAAKTATTKPIMPPLVLEADAVLVEPIDTGSQLVVAK